MSHRLRLGSSDHTLSALSTPSVSTVSSLSDVGVYPSSVPISPVSSTSSSSASLSKSDSRSWKPLENKHTEIDSIQVKSYSFLCWSDDLFVKILRFPQVDPSHRREKDAFLQSILNGQV